jgi:L-threonylcarbamoyladenylate synthase
VEGDAGPKTSETSESAVARAVEVLRRGGLVAFPTETVYGLGADAANPSAVERIFAVKGRPPFHPLIVHLPDRSALEEWAAEVAPEAWALAEAFWPGALTLVVPRAERVPDAVTGGLDTVGLRVPAAPLALELLSAFGAGVAAPSANRFGRVSPTTADHVRADLGDAVDLVLDGGPCSIGVESTIVDCTGERFEILRPGGVSAEALSEVLGCEIGLRTGAPGAAPSVRAPGTLPSHYAPRARVELVAAGPEAAVRARALLDEGRRAGLLAPAPEELLGLPGEVEVLPPAGGPEDYARCLYDRLREADRRDLDVLLVIPPPQGGLGTAVTDRLRRAAAGGAG